MGKYVIDKPLISGLGAADRDALNAPILSDCYGVRPTPAGLLPEVDIPAFPVSVTWPFPQIIRGTRRTFFAFETALHLVNTGIPNWIGGPALTVSDAQAPTTQLSLVAGGGQWHFVDLGLSWILVNGKQAVWHLEGDPYLHVGIPAVHGEDVHFPKTATQHRGRVVFGNTGAWHYGWNAFWNGLMSKAPTGMTSNLASGSNLVFWTSVGDARLLWQYILGPTYFTEAEVKHQWRRNDCGWMVMPWEGVVHRTLPLGDSVVVYGDNGIAALVRAGETYGLREIAKVGCAGRSAAFGTDAGHIFLDTTGCLWSLRPDLSVEKLGYRQHFSTMLTGTPVIVHDASEGEFWISDGVTSYVLTTSGLARAQQRPTSMAVAGGVIKAFANKSAALDDRRVVTNRTDLGSRLSKHVWGIEIGCNDPSSYEVTLEFRNNANNVMRTRGPVTPDANGFASCNATCTELAIRVTCPSELPMDLDYIAVHFNELGAKTCARDVVGG